MQALASRGVNQFWLTMSGLQPGGGPTTGRSNPCGLDDAWGDASGDCNGEKHGSEGGALGGGDEGKAAKRDSGRAEDGEGALWISATLSSISRCLNAASSRGASQVVSGSTGGSAGGSAGSACQRHSGTDGGRAGGGEAGSRPPYFPSISSETAPSASRATASTGRNAGASCVSPERTVLGSKTRS